MGLSLFTTMFSKEANSSVVEKAFMTIKLKM
jgi:hypothetical protein